MKTAAQRKAASIERLKAEGIAYLDELPPIADASQARRRSAAEIGKRALSSWLAIQAACDRQAERYTPEVAQICMHLLHGYELSGQLSAQEALVLSNQGSGQDVINMVWKYEALWPLLWTLGLVPQLGKPDCLVDGEHIMRLVAQCPDFAAFMQQCQLRDMDSILDEADLAYRYHWACVNARINGRDMPGGLIAGVAQERHAGLSWLIDTNGQDNWDQPDINT